MKRILEKIKCKGIMICIFTLLFSMNVMAASNSDYFASATTIATNGNLVSGKLSDSIVKKAYVFKTSSNNSYYKLTGINSSVEEGVRFVLYSETGQAVEDVDRIVLTENQQHNVVAKLQKNTRYYVLVEAAWDDTADGDYKLSVEEIIDDVEDEYQSAKTLNFGTQISGKSEVKDDVDFYKFKTTSDNNCFYKFTFINSDVDLVDGVIYDENMVVVQQSIWVWENQQYDSYHRLSGNKTYYIRIMGEGVGNYKLAVNRLADDVKDTYSEATNLTLNKSISSGIQCSDDVDFFKIKTNNLTTEYTVQLTNKASEGYAEFSVYDSNMLSVRYSGSANAGSTGEEKYTLKKNKTYYIKVTGTQEGNYILTVKGKAPKTYKITYKLNGGKNNSSNPASYTKSQTVSLKNPTRKGYIFKGWYTDKSCKNRIKKISKGSTKNYTIYAKWSKVSLKKGSITTLNNSGKGKLRIKVASVSGAKGYEIVIASNKKMTENKTVYTSSKRDKTISKLSKGTYYVKVRAYATDSTGNKVYGKYSPVKKVKVRK